MQLHNNLTKVKQLVRNLETHLMCPMLHLTWDLVCTSRVATGGPRPTHFHLWPTQWDVQLVIFQMDVIY